MRLQWIREALLAMWYVIIDFSRNKKNLLKWSKVYHDIQPVLGEEKIYFRVKYFVFLL